MNNTIIGVDLAKHFIQLCVVTKNKLVSNTEITAQDFTAWLVQSQPAMIVF